MSSHSHPLHPPHPKTHTHHISQTQSHHHHFLISTFKKLITTAYHTITSISLLIILQLSDLLIHILNLITPSYPTHRNVPPPFSPDSPPDPFHHPFIYLTCTLAKTLGPKLCPDWLKWWSVWDGIGEDGRWREVDLDMALKHGDRGPCPGLNALANHGIINPDGRNLSFHQIVSAFSRTYNVSPIFAIRALYGASPLFEGGRSINLSDLSAHGMIEHDGSLLRPDIDGTDTRTFKEIQSHPIPSLIDRFFPASKTKTDVKLSEFSDALTMRRTECMNSNPTYYRSMKFDLIGSENCAILYAITGGQRNVIRELCGVQGYERFVDRNWRSACQEGFGLTMFRAQVLLGLIEFRTGSYFRTPKRQV